MISFNPSSYALVPTNPIPAEALTDVPLPERAAGAGNISGKITLPATAAPNYGIFRAIALTSVSDIKVWVKNHPEINAKTDADGNFVLKNVPKAEKENGHTLEYEKVEGTDKFNGVIAEIPVVEGKQIDVSKYIGPLVIKKSGVIQGKIALSDGLSPLGAEAYIAGISAMIAKADDDGSFSLMDVPAGTFNIVFQSFGYEIARQTVTVEANEVKQLSVIQLKKFTAVSTLGAIEGYALASDRSPVPGALVSILSADKTVDIGAVASATGHYKFSNIPAGKYKIVFIKDGYKGAESEVNLAAGATLKHDQNMVKIDSTQANVAAYGLISGNVKDADTGAPIRNAVVLTVPPTRQFYTDYNGYFDFLITPGTYTLKIQKIGYNEEQISLSIQADKVSELEATLQSKASASKAATITLNASSLTINAGDTTQLTATVKDFAGNILSGKPIVWSSSNSSIAEVTQSGLVTAKGAGACNITAAVEGKSVSLSLTVSGALGTVVKSIKIFPETISLKLTENKQFVIFATYNDGSSKIIPNTLAAWSSSSDCLTMLEKGNYVALSPGTAVITAKFESLTSTANVTALDSADTQPPVISHSIPAVYEAGKDLIISAGVSDNVAVAKVWLYFRTIGEADYLKVEMPQTTAGRYSYTIPPALTTNDGINYYIEAEDTKLPVSNKSTFPVNGNAAPAVLKPAASLSSLTLSKTTDKTNLAATYDLTPIVAIAKYTDGTGKIVNPSWTVVSGGGSINGKIYTAPPKGTQAVLKAVYSENGINVDANFILNLQNVTPVVTSVEVIVPATMVEATQAAAVVLVKDQFGATMTEGFTLTYAITTGNSTVTTAGLVTSGSYDANTAANNNHVLTVTATPTEGTAVSGTANFTVTADDGKPRVVSVTAPNSKILIVTYSKKVSTTATTVTNYKLYNTTTGATVSLATTSSTTNITATALFTDATQKVVRITLGTVGSDLTGYPAGGLDDVDYRLYVSGVTDTTSNANTIAANTNVVFRGTTEPGAAKPVINAMAYNKGTGTLVITLDKAVTNALIYSNIKFNGTVLTAAVTNNAQTTGEENKISVTLASADKATVAALTGDITITILANAIADANGNKNAETSMVASLTVPPVMTSAVYDEATNILTMGFSQTLDLSTTTLRGLFTSGTNFQMKSNEFTATALSSTDTLLTTGNNAIVQVLLSNAHADAFEAIATHTNPKVLVAANAFKNTTGDYNLKADDSTTEYPAVAMTIVRDTVKPEVTSITFDEATKKLVFNFNVKINKSTVVPGNILLFMDKNKTAFTTTNLTGLTPTEVSDANTLTFDLTSHGVFNGAVGLKAAQQGPTDATTPATYASYVTFVANTFQKSGSLLKNVAVTEKATATTITYTDNVAPALASAAITVTNQTTISFSFDEKVNKADAENKDNYKIYLMSGGVKQTTQLAVNSVKMTDYVAPSTYTQKTVQIVTGTQTQNATYLLEVANVKDLAGNVISSTDVAKYSKEFTGSGTTAPAPKIVSAKIRDNGNQSFDTADYIAVTFDRPVKLNTSSTQTVNDNFTLTGGGTITASYNKSNVTMSTDAADLDCVVLIKPDDALVSGSGTKLTVGTSRININSSGTPDLILDKYSDVKAAPASSAATIQSPLGATEITEALLTDVDNSGTINKGDTLKITFSNPLKVVSGTMGVSNVITSNGRNFGTGATISTTMTTSVESSTLTITMGDSPTLLPTHIKAGETVNITNNYLKDSWDIQVPSSVTKAITTAAVAAPYITKAEWVDVTGNGASVGDYVYYTFNVPVYLNSDGTDGNGAGAANCWKFAGTDFNTTSKVTKVAADAKMVRVEFVGSAPTLTPTVTSAEIGSALGNKLTNFAGEPAVAATTTNKITVPSDTTAPTITSAEFISHDKIKVVFSKAVNVSNYVKTDGSAGLNVNGEGTREFNAVALDAADTTGKTAIFTNEANASIAEQTNGIASSATTGLKIIAANGITDLAGNKLAATQAGADYIAIGKDVTAPDYAALGYQLPGKIGNLVHTDTATTTGKVANTATTMSLGELALLEVYFGASVPTASTEPTGVAASFVDTLPTDDIITGLLKATAGHKIYYRLRDRAGNKSEWLDSTMTVSAP